MGRVVLHHGLNPQSAGTPIEDRAVKGCWFEWHRQGGCGPGQLKLERSWAETADVQPGDWISIGPSTVERWYLGRVDEWRSDYPAGVVVTLAGMVDELNEIYPGGFGREGVAPQRYGQTDAFPYDPDHALQQYRPTQTVESLVDELVQQHVLPRTHVASADPASAGNVTRVDSITMRGEESLRSLLKDLAVRAGGAAWGIDANARFFFQLNPADIVASYQLSDDVTRCAATRSRDILFNRLQITGDYIYDRLDGADDIAQRVYRFRQIHVRDTSLTQYGEHRIRLWLPWIRTDDDARRFAEAFFDLYAAPPTKYLIDAVVDPAQPPMPWLGRVELLDEAGQRVADGVPSVVRIQFDEWPTARLEIGPEDPRRLWPEPPEDDRYELPTVQRHSESSESSESWLSFSSLSGLSSVDGGTSYDTSEQPPTSEPVLTSFGSSNWGSLSSLPDSLPTSYASSWESSWLSSQPWGSGGSSDWWSSDWAGSSLDSSEWMSTSWQSSAGGSSWWQSSSLASSAWSGSGWSGNHASSIWVSSESPSSDWQTSDVFSSAWSSSAWNSGGTSGSQWTSDGVSSGLGSSEWSSLNSSLASTGSAWSSWLSSGTSWTGSSEWSSVEAGASSVQWSTGETSDDELWSGSSWLTSSV